MIPCVRADERVKLETSCGSSKSAYCHRLKFGNNNYLLFVQLVGPRVCAIDNYRICLLLCLGVDYQYRLILGLLARLPIAHSSIPVRHSSISSIPHSSMLTFVCTFGNSRMNRNICCQNGQSDSSSNQYR